MKNLINTIFILLATLSMTIAIADTPKGKKLGNVTDVTTIKVIAFTDDSSLVVNGTVTGLETGPMGDYKVKITNGNKFKGESFSKMDCTLLPHLEEVYGGAANGNVLVTTFTIDGVDYESLGFYSPAKAFPIEGYEVVIRNGKGRGLWNSMNCTIK